MEHEGHTIGSEGRRQHDETDPEFGDKPDMEERIADREAREAEEAGAEAAAAPDADAGDPVPDPDEAGLDHVQSPEGVKPGTAREITDAGGETRES